MKKLIFVLLTCALFQTAFAQENTEPADQSAEQRPETIGFTLGLGVTAGNNIVNAIGTERVFFNMRMRIYNSLLRVDMHLLDQNTRTGDLTVRITNDINNLCSLCADTFSWFLRIILMVAFVFCFILSWQMTIVYLILTPHEYCTICQSYYCTRSRSACGVR
jgi:ABC-type multidrug transport system fused ATPase/permease subunit